MSSVRSPNPTDKNPFSHQYISILLDAGLPAAGRALSIPADNLAKRLQLQSKPVGFKDIGQLVFQGGKGFDMVSNAYRGIMVSYFYKGLQLSSLDAMFNVQKQLEDKFGESKVNKLLTGVTVGAVQTAVLHPISTVRTRVQVNNPDLINVNNTSIPAIFRKSPLVGAIYQGKLYNGLKENFARNSSFLIVSGMAVEPYTKLLVKNKLFGTDTEKANDKQESIARALSGMTATTSSVFFDNVKTLKQTNESFAKQGMFHLIKDSLKTHGFLRTIRPSAPYLVSEGLGYVGFYAGKALAQKIREASKEQGDSPQLTPAK